MASNDDNVWRLIGGVCIDYRANRARALTIRNNVGIQLISAADGSRKQIQVPAGARVSSATWSSC